MSLGPNWDHNKENSHRDLDHNKVNLNLQKDQNNLSMDLIFQNSLMNFYLHGRHNQVNWDLFKDYRHYLLFFIKFNYFNLFLIKIL